MRAPLKSRKDLEAREVTPRWSEIRRLVTARHFFEIGDEVAATSSCDLLLRHVFESRMSGDRTARRRSRFRRFRCRMEARNARMAGRWDRRHVRTQCSAANGASSQSDRSAKTIRFWTSRIGGRRGSRLRSARAAACSVDPLGVGDEDGRQRRNGSVGTPRGQAVSPHCAAHIVGPLATCRRMRAFSRGLRAALKVARTRSPSVYAEGG